MRRRLSGGVQGAVSARMLPWHALGFLGNPEQVIVCGQFFFAGIRLDFSEDGVVYDPSESEVVEKDDFVFQHGDRLLLLRDIPGSIQISSGWGKFFRRIAEMPLLAWKNYEYQEVILVGRQ
jgi:hypothetical protein